MSEQNHQIAVLADLDAPNAEEIKGGPTTKGRRDVILKTPVVEPISTLPDLSPSEQATGG